MAINSINNALGTAGSSLNVNDLSKMGTASQAAKTAAAEDEISQKVTREDNITISGDNGKTDETGIYSRESIIQQLKESEEQRVQAFQETLKSMLAQQGEEVNLAIGDMKLHVTPEQSAKAKEAISDGGEYSVEKVTDRIMDMAKALAGDDPSKIDMLKDAVIKGFEKAAGALGKKSLDEMPDITKKTYESVMKEFDDWKKSYETQESVQTVQNTTANNIAAQAANQKVAQAPATNPAAAAQAAAVVNS